MHHAVRSLPISVCGSSTSHTSRAHILEKMGLENNAQLTHYALQHQLVE